MTDSSALSTADIPHAWFVNKPGDVRFEELDEYFREGTWRSPNLDAHDAAIAEMRIGDQIACKSVGKQRTDLPFFSADQPASVMSIHATGTVTSIDTSTGVIGVDWSVFAKPKRWYFYTAVRSLWRVGSEREYSRDLLAFAFQGVDQPLDKYLDDPFWSERYVRFPDFSWIPFYGELADRLAEYAETRAPLVELFTDLAHREQFLTSFLTDQYPDGTSAPVDDIDPFTVIGTFNRGLKDENRLHIASILGQALGVEAPLPQDFDGVPLLPNQNSWFVRYAKDRQPGDIDALWQVFTSGLALAREDTPAARKDFVDAYDAALEISNVRWNLSQGLYWIRPDTFVTLEGRSRPFINHRYGLPEPTDGSSYLSLVDDLRRAFTRDRTSVTSFPLLSFAAWSFGDDHTTPRTVTGFAEWAVRIAQEDDLDAWEHGYKRRTAHLLALSRRELEQGSATWPDTFAEGLKAAGTLLHFTFKGDVIKAVNTEPDHWADVFQQVWQDGTADSLDVLAAALRSKLPRAYIGNCTSLGALLLMGTDTEQNAPYLTTRTERWYRLTDFPGPADNSSASDRYATFLRFLDELCHAVDEQTHTSVSRLEAQGMAFTVTDGDPPGTWDKKLVHDFERYRGDEERAPRAWLVRSRHIPTTAWLERSRISLRAEYLEDPAAGATLPRVRDAVESGYPQAEYPERQDLTNAFHALLSRMAPNDIVAGLDENSVHLGRITGNVTFSDGELRRATDWLVRATLDDLPDRVMSELDQQGVIVEITEALPELDAMVNGDSGDGGEDAPLINGAEQPPRGVTFPAINDDFAASIHMPAPFLEDITDLLSHRRQIILYGPPGTGKTFLALELSKYLVGAEHSNNVQLVQFHPSYAYEDFFEGFRPRGSDSGSVTFEVRPGPLRRIAQEARQSPDTPFFLIIDELNRANLAKVFGELYFLLEYRNHAVQLQYSHEQFRLPENLYFIGTMNTADRSVAILDAAMRRRFAFIELHPEESPVEAVLARFLDSSGAQPQDDRARLLRALNAAIDEDDRDFKIGPSYLMRPEATDRLGLERIWRFDILPLLEEHYYGRFSPSEIRGRFGLANLRGRIQAERSTLDGGADIQS